MLRFLAATGAVLNLLSICNTTAAPPASVPATTAATPGDAYGVREA